MGTKSTVQELAAPSGENADCLNTYCKIAESQTTTKFSARLLQPNLQPEPRPLHDSHTAAQMNETAKHTPHTHTHTHTQENTGINKYSEPCVRWVLERMTNTSDRVPSVSLSDCSLPSKHPPCCFTGRPQK